MNPLPALVALLLSLTAGAQDQTASSGVSGQMLDRPQRPAPPPQQISFSSTVFEFGKIAAGVVVQHDFKFTNSSDSPAIVERVEPDCHCTTVGEWKLTLNPGEAGIIPVKYSSSGYHGPIDQTIKVFSEDPNRPPIILHMKGEVWQPVELNPIKADFILTREQKTPATRSVRIRTRAGEFHFTSTPESSNKSFAATIRPVTEGQDYYLDIATVGTLPPGTVEGEITVKTDSVNLSLVTIPVSAFVPADVSCTPPLVRLPPGATARATEQRFVLRNNTAGSLAVKEVLSSLPEVTVEFQEIRPGKVFHIVSHIPKDFDLIGRKLVLTIHTDSSETPEIRIPITQLRLTNLGS